METRILKGTIGTQVWPVIVFVLLAAKLLSDTGFGADLHLNSIGYIELLLAVVVLCVACANLIKPPTLSLDERGFTWRSWRYSASYPWADIDTFLLGPSTIGGRPKIAFNFGRNKIPSQAAATKLNRSVNGFDRSMANVWKMPSDKLVDLLNDYLQRSRSRNP